MVAALTLIAIVILLARPRYSLALALVVAEAVIGLVWWYFTGSIQFIGPMAPDLPRNFYGFGLTIGIFSAGRFLVFCGVVALRKTFGPKISN